jgi:thiamine biosynthesis lipoprotein
VGELARSPFLVNFGGDLYAPGPRAGGIPWSVAIDDPEHTGQPSGHAIALERGALATSGDARRFVWHARRRLGHLLDPRTGWPVEGAPRSVTVLAATALEAGTLATLAMLAGPGAEALLTGAGVRFHVVRGAQAAC